MPHDYRHLRVDRETAARWGLPSTLRRALEIVLGGDDFDAMDAERCGWMRFGDRLLERA